MHRRAANVLLTGVLVVCACSAAVLGSRNPQPGASATYQVVSACSLVPLAEVKKLAPWAPHLDSFAKAEEEAIGTHGSSCNYPTAHVQVMAYRQQTVDAMRKTRKLEPVSGVGDEAYAHDNSGQFAELYARVGPHLLTVQLDIGTNETFETAKPSLIELARAFASRLR